MKSESAITSTRAASVLNPKGRRRKCTVDEIERMEADNTLNFNLLTLT